MGGGGNDQLLGGDGNDQLNGGNGNDLMNGGPRGADAFNGGAGRDRVTYEGRPQNLVLSIDGVANDGVPEAPATDTLPARPAEGDNIGLDVEDLSGGRGNDRITGSAANNALQGGDGADMINGGGGHDELRGDAGNDILNGGDGNDILIGGAHADVFNGGAGNDTADYREARTSLVITIDGVANDGAPALPATATTPARPAENDNVRLDVENVIGGNGNDRIAGSAAPNRLIGGPGNDELRGLAGDDVLDGGAGVDKLFGGIGNDFLIDLDHDDRPDSLDGGDGDDKSANDANAILVSVELPNQPPPPPPPTTR